MATDLSHNAYSPVRVAATYPPSPAHSTDTSSRIVEATSVAVDIGFSGQFQMML